MRVGLSGGGMSDERLHRVETGGEQRREVPVAAELAQQRLRVPEHQVRFVRPVQRGVRGEQRATVRLLDGGERGPAREPGRLGDVGQSGGGPWGRPRAGRRRHRAAGRR
ncbi:hypothetical protein DEF23_11815 [Marinitenerispora sediminis]|uniref:Uncharacterized protein n=1 Tax=Marinitenerispora sediminis TaxID=1931232 RepID=A0A368T6B4_9ACTN|nr:hypothetical protein [Marinitenerispora sediminis]RCV52256.1 hypothetical protein DEF28_13455 [Marinitenerispora sediminis]RCV56885.1 hypothetical protein DEF23_11815 [Marinitenerispora sediminis]RCV59038.1 hypothetical protein DEF24_11260 [Marinitenerispora sediminis]